MSSYKHLLLELYHKEHSLVRHHLDSYNDFVNVKIKDIIETHGKISIPHHHWSFELSFASVEKPTITEDRIERDIYPHQCRLRAITYSAKVKVNVKFTKADKSGFKTVNNVTLCTIPAMVKSDVCRLNDLSVEEAMHFGECPKDPGGYFITSGTEKVFLMQEQMMKNRYILDKMYIVKKTMKIPNAEKIGIGKIVCSVVSSTLQRKTKTTVFINHGYIYVENHLFEEPAPLIILFSALGIAAHKDIFESIGNGSELFMELENSFLEALREGVCSEKEALLWLNPRMRKSTDLKSNHENLSASERLEVELYEIKYRISQRVLQHIPVENNGLTNRARYLGLMVRRLLLAQRGNFELDDRDFYGSKRLDLVGDFLALSFEDQLHMAMHRIEGITEKTINRTCTREYNPVVFINSVGISRAILLNITSGCWNLPRFQMKRVGVTQDLNRLSYMATLGHLARINSNYEKARKIAGPRSINLSQYGYVCLADTPEGAQCGLVKNLAFLAEVTVDINPDTLARLIYVLPDFDYQLDEYKFDTNKYLVMLNGVPLGWTTKPKELGMKLRQYRRFGKIPAHVSIFYTPDEDILNISSDGGRLVRPYIIVEKGKSKITPKKLREISNGSVTWDDLMLNGFIEYLDAPEAYIECLVASHEKELTMKHTHLDIDPSTCLGTVASLIPYANHNQSPRNTYQCAMGKQSVGIIAFNQYNRYSAVQHTLCSPQKPFTLTRVAKLIGYDELPAGQNAIVAIMSYGGFDIEDAVIVNESSIQAGLFATLTTKSFREELKGQYEMLGISSEANYKERSLDVDGTASPGKYVSNHNILINKLTPENSLDFLGISPQPIKPAQVTESSTASTSASTATAAGLASNPLTTTTNPLTTSTSKSAINNSSQSLRAHPVIYNGIEPAQIHKVILTLNEDGYKVCRVSTVQKRTLEVGDKLSSRHGQKGIIGQILPEYKLPQTIDGVVPDIIMNPHGFPSRMTVGKLIELMANKCSVFDGVTRDCSAFDDRDLTGFEETLIKYGYKSNGKTKMIHPESGEYFEGEIFTGPVFYQRLKHMVQDKIHARSRGFNMPLTRQPMEGRSKEGGLRIGEMERDCLIAYGASATIRERMMFSSDPFKIWICEQCGGMATSRYWCVHCESSQNIHCSTVPYASKLLLQELMVMGIKTKITLE